MATRVEVTYQGERICRSVHGPSGAEIITGEPPTEDAPARHFGPTDLLAASLGACVLTVMGTAARTREIDITGARAEVVKEMASKPRRRIGRLALRVTLPARLDDKARTILERAAAACPVKHTMAADTEVELAFDYVDDPAGSSE